jgi:hypothetical protein
MGVWQLPSKPRYSVPEQPVQLATTSAYPAFPITIAAVNFASFPAVPEPVIGEPELVQIEDHSTYPPLKHSAEFALLKGGASDVTGISDGGGLGRARTMFKSTGEPEDGTFHASLVAAHPAGCRL